MIHSHIVLIHHMFWVHITVCAKILILVCFLPNIYVFTSVIDKKTFKRLLSFNKTRHPTSVGCCKDGQNTGVSIVFFLFSCELHGIITKTGC